MIWKVYKMEEFISTIIWIGFCITVFTITVNRFFNNRKLRRETRIVESERERIYKSNSHQSVNKKDDKVEQLLKLSDMLEKGLLTKEEFEIQKKAIL